MDALTKAATNRSIRTIKTELDFLADASVITSSQLSSILALLPNDAPGIPTPNGTRSPATNGVSTPAYQPPTNQFAAASLNEKSFHSNNNSTPQPTPSPAPPPPAYNQTAPAIAQAQALYAYNPQDAGDLAMIPHDKIAILEFMNADWAKGRSDRTGQEGIFPRSYVNIIEEKAANGGLGTGEKANGLGMAPPPGSGNNYGNMPLDVSQGGSNKEPSKANEQGKKFGKKLGNAAIFGAGATIGSNIVNSIF